MPSTLNPLGGSPISLYHPTTYRQAYLNLWVVVPTYGLNLKVCQPQQNGGTLGSVYRHAVVPLYRHNAVPLRHCNVTLSQRYTGMTA